MAAGVEFACRDAVTECLFKRDQLECSVSTCVKGAQWQRTLSLLAVIFLTETLSGRDQLEYDSERT